MNHPGELHKSQDIFQSRLQEVQIRREAERGLGDTSEKLTGELSTAVKLLEAERSELSQVRTKLATLEKSEQALLNEKATFTEAQRRDQVSYTELQKRLEAVEKLYEEEQDKRSRAQDKLATLEKSHEALLKEKARLGEAESGHLALHTHLRENLVAVEKLRQEEQTRREQVQEKLATLEGSQRTLLAEQAKNLESQKQQAERQAQQSLASANADLEARLATAAAEVTELKGKQADWTALQTQASDDQKAIRSLHKVIEIATSTYENLQRELDAKGEACTQLQEQLQTKASEEDRLHQELDKQHADYTDLQKELADKTLKYEADMEQKDFCIQELQAKVQDRNESLGELLKGMKAQRRQTNAMNPAYQSDTGSMEDDYSLPRKQKKICLWAKHAPTVATGFGPRIGGVIPEEGRVYDADKLPRTVHINDQDVRWVLKKRKVRKTDADDPEPEVIRELTV